MGVRSISKGTLAAEKLRNEFPSSNIDVWELDMTNYESVLAFVENLSREERIDIVILNAGMMTTSLDILPGTGHEVTLQVNYLSTVLLTILLLPILKKKGGHEGRTPVISVVSSDAAYFSTFNKSTAILEAFNKPTPMNASAYNDAKLFSILFVSMLAEKIDPGDVLINTVNPGMTKGTAFFATAPWFMKPFIGLVQTILARTTEAGASIYLEALFGVGREVGSHGSFISDWAIKPFPKIWYVEEGKELMEKLWEETMNELEFVGAREIVEGLKKGHE